MAGRPVERGASKRPASPKCILSKIFRAAPIRSLLPEKHPPGLSDNAADAIAGSRSRFLVCLDVNSAFDLAPRRVLRGKLDEPGFGEHFIRCMGVPS